MTARRADAAVSVPAFVDRRTLATAFCVSTRTVSRWLQEGCPCLRVGRGGKGDARFKLADVESWLSARSIAANR